MATAWGWGLPMIGRWVTRALAIALLALGLPLAGGLTSPASAATQWIDGGFAMSSVMNCPSMIFGSPYFETGVTTYTGYLGDLSAATPNPAVGQTFYIHVVVGAPGNPCPNQFAWVDINLPAGLQLATATSPMFCLYDNVAQSGCDSSKVANSPFHQGAISLIRSTDGVFAHEIWPVPTGHMWEFQIPVKATSQIVNGTLQALVKVLDGNSSPWLDARAQMLVLSSGLPSAPTITYASPSTTITPGAAPSYRSVGQIRTNVAGSARFRMGTDTRYLTTSDALPPLGTGSWQAWDDWTPFVPVAGITYHWTLCFTPTGGSELCGADQTFVGLAADGIPPTLTSITALNNPVTGRYATFRITFSEPVQGFANSLIMSVGGLSSVGAPVLSPASGLAKTVTVTVDVGTGDGTIGVGIGNNGSITDAAGNPMSGPGGSANAAVHRATVDVTKPTITTSALPAVSLATATQRWIAADNIGLASFAVRARTTTAAGVVGAFGSPTTYGPAVRSALVTVTPGTTRCVQVEAGDTSGNKTAGAVRCTATPMDERRAKSAGKWATVASTAAYTRTLSKSVKVGSSKYLTGMTGHSIVVVAQKGRGAGVVQVLLNGVVKATWNLAATKSIPKAVLVVPVRAGFSKRTVMVRVKVAGKAGVLIDGLGVGA